MKRNKKSIALLVSLVLLLAVTVGGTLAYLIDTKGPLINTFIPSQVTTSVTETNENGIKKDVKIQNTGDIDAYIRAAIVVTWQDENGNVYGQAPVTDMDCDHSNCDCDYIISIGNGWTFDGGFYYCNGSVAPDGYTGVLIESCTSKNTAPEGYALNVEIIGSGIQSKPESAVKDAWGFVPGT